MHFFTLIVREKKKDVIPSYVKDVDDGKDCVIKWWHLASRNSAQ